MKPASNQRRARVTLGYGMWRQVGERAPHLKIRSSGEGIERIGCYRWV